MAELLRDTESVLQNVVEHLIDSQQTFKEIGEQLKDETLKHYFLAESLKRSSFKGDLEDVLIKEGKWDAFKEKGSVGGALHRAWGDLKARLGGGDHALLETAESVGDKSKEVYAEALQHHLPLPIHQLLSQQAAHIQASHDYIRIARDAGR